MKDQSKPVGNLAAEMADSLQAELAGACDDKVIRIVSVIDGLAQRGDADTFIEAIRPRLAVLRPQRPANFTRILFSPLDAVIVPPASFGLTRLGVPRSALTAISAQVVQGLGSGWSDIESMMKEFPHDPAAVGRVVWPQASSVLKNAKMPEGWEAATGLSAADFEVLAPVCAGIFAAATRIEDVAAHFDPAAPRDLKALWNILSAAPPVSGALGTLLMILWTRVPETLKPIMAKLDAMPKELGEPRRAERDKAINFVVAKMEADSSPAPDLADAARQAFRVAAMVEAVLRRSDNHSAKLVTRCSTLRRVTNEKVRQRFSIEAGSLMKMTSTLSAFAPDEEMSAFETLIQKLRYLAMAGSQLGGESHYEMAFQRAATSLANRSNLGKRRAGLVDLLLNWRHQGTAPNVCA